MAYLALGIAADTGDPAVDPALIVLAVLFLAEFFVRLWDAPSRYLYARHHWLDFISAIPLIGGLRALRLLRLLRLGAAFRVLVAAEQAARARGTGRHSLWYIGPALTVIWFAAATAHFTFEHGVDQHVKDFGDSLYWAFATAMTVGYGAGTPVTAGGKVVSGVLILVSVGLVGIISSRLAVLWLGAEVDENQKLHARLNDIEATLAAMHDAVLRMEGRSGTTPPRPPQHEELGG